MRLLFEIDTKDYAENGTVGMRPSVRGIIIKNGRIAMIYSRKNDYYEFPGGGMEPGENHSDTLIREVREESGLRVIRDSIREYGYVHRVQKGKYEDIFIQDNYYYLCDTEDQAGEQQLDDWEDEEQFVLIYVTPDHAVEVNRNHHHGEKQDNRHFQVMLDREIRVLEQLIREGMIGAEDICGGGR